MTLPIPAQPNSPSKGQYDDDSLSRRCRMLARSYGEHSLVDEFQGSEDEDAHSTGSNRQGSTFSNSRSSPADSNPSSSYNSPSSLKSPNAQLFSPPSKLAGLPPPSPSFSQHALDEIIEEGDVEQLAESKRAKPQPVSSPPVSSANHAFDPRELESPVKSAFSRGTMCVSVDVWLVDGRLLVGQDQATLNPSRTLEKLYIGMSQTTPWIGSQSNASRAEPLVRHFSPEGSMSPIQSRRRLSQTFNSQVANLPFLLTVSLRSEPVMTLQYLSFALTALDDEGLLTTYSEHSGIFSPGQILVTLSGDVPIDELEKQQLRFVFAEQRPLPTSERDDETMDKTLAPVVRVQLHDLVSDPSSASALTERDKSRVRETVESVHRAHKLLRVDGLPKFPLHEREAMRDALRECGVDYCT